MTSGGDFYGDASNDASRGMVLPEDGLAPLTRQSAFGGDADKKKRSRWRKHPKKDG